jgi:hypothetical protein
MSKEKPKENIQKKVSCVDVRIGLNLLGEHGRILLSQYIKAKQPKQ